MRHLKIGIDLRRIVFGETGGLTQWLHGTLQNVFTREVRHTYVVFHTAFNYHLFANTGPHVVRHTLSTQHYYTELQDRVEYEGGFDLLLRWYPFGVLERFPLERQIVCIPDCQHEAFPEYFDPAHLRQRRQAFGVYQTCGGAIATLTEFSRSELLNNLWTTIDDVFLMPPGVPEGIGATGGGELTPRERSLIPTRPFFLYSANLWPHKNHRRIVEAFRKFRVTHPDYELVFTGHPDGWEKLAKECKGLPVRHLGYVRPQVLAELQRRAVALAHLSLYEGFGIPILEAFATGTPVICGDRTAMPEVAGDAAVMCDTTSPDSMAAALAQVADDPALRKRLQERGTQRLKAFSWDRAGDALLAAFDRVAARADRAVIRARVVTPPVVSIVTPSFNQGRFIRQTIDSVLNQDYPHVDYQVIDGGSTDDTVAILKSYGDRIRWVSEPDRGQSHAINKGMAQARGAIRAYLNSDDLLRPGAVARVVQYLRDNPACDLVYGKDALIDANGEYLRMYPTAPYSFERLVEQCCISQPAAFWRKRLAERVGPFDESLQLVMDYDYWLRADRAGGRLEYIPEILAHTRIHRESKSSGSGSADRHRQRFFPELFAVSLRHAGLISPSYVNMWLQATILNRYPWTNRYKEFLMRVCWNYFYWRYQCGLPRWQIALRLAIKERPRLRPTVRALIRALNPRGWFCRPLPAPVPLGGDLWLGPEFAIEHRGGPAQLTGEPARSGVLRVFRNNTELTTIALQAHETTDIQIDIPEPSRLRLVFSDAEHHQDGRTIAFKVQGTTLFAERDVA